MSDSDGKSEIASTEPIMASTLVSESGGALKEKDPHSLNLNGKIACRAFRLVTGYNPPRAYFATDAGSFFIELGDAQIAAFIEDGGAYLYRRIKNQ